MQRGILRTWIKLMWLDWLCLAAIAAYAWLVGIIAAFRTYLADRGLKIYNHKTPFVTRVFPVIFQNGEVVYPEFAYPQRTELFPAFRTTLVSAGVPLFLLLVSQFWVQSFWDLNNALLGLKYALIGASAFQVTIKMFIGGLRPHFLSVCLPFWPVVKFPEQERLGQGFGKMMFDRSICHGDPKEIDDALTSFPSGHATAAFAGFIFLSLYLNGKVKLFTDRRTPFWKLLLVMTPVLLGTLLAAAKCVDEYHNWYDVLVGGIIGTMFAFLAYRMMFAATWNPELNGIPLMPRSWDSRSWE